MAKEGEHSLYHIGFIKKYHPDCVYLHKTSKIKEASNSYGERCHKVVLLRQWELYRSLLILLLSREKTLHILGAKLWQILMFLPSIILSERRPVFHMHGQIYALKKRGLKYWIWRLLDIAGLEIVVSNPAYLGPSFVKKIENINFFKSFNRPLLDDKGGCNAGNLGGTYVDKKKVGLVLSYKEYIQKLKMESCVVINFDNDYYLYSPSGRMSEAKMFDQEVLAIVAPSLDVNIVAYILKSYQLKFRIK